MTNKPTLSIIIPVYNSAKTLPDTLETIKSSYTVEVVLSDDSSTDKETKELLQSLRQKYRIIFNPINNGPGSALNNGAKVSKGKYIMQLDSDDLLIEGALDKLIQHLETHDEIDLVWGDLITFGTVNSNKAMAPILDPWYVTHLNNIPCCAVMRKTAWDKAGGWRVGRPGYHDWGMWISLAMIGSKGEKLEDFHMLQYRVSVNSLFHSTRSSYEARRKATLNNFQHLKKWRRKHWLKSKAPWTIKILLPLYNLLPVNAYRKSRQGKAWAAKYWFKDNESFFARKEERDAKIP